MASGEVYTLESALWRMASGEVYTLESALWEAASGDVHTLESAPWGFQLEARCFWTFLVR